MAVSDPLNLTLSAPESECGSDADVPPLLDAIGDDVSRAILSAGMRSSTTAEELAAECGVSESTIYRRLESLCDLGLVERCNHLISDSDAKSSYRTTVDGLTVELDESGVRVETATKDPVVEAMETMLDAIDLDHVGYDAQTGTVDVRFSLTDANLATLMLLCDRLPSLQKSAPPVLGSIGSR